MILLYPCQTPPGVLHPGLGSSAQDVDRVKQVQQRVTKMLRVPLTRNKSSLYDKEEVYCSYHINEIQKAKCFFFRL